MYTEGIGKYQEYLTLTHEWEDLNCLTLLEHLYKKYLNIDFMDTWLRADRKDGSTNIDARWFAKYRREDFLNEISNWIKIELTQIKEFDILVFTSKGNLPKHFGMYIGQNYMIHMLQNNPCQISFLDDTYRDKLNIENTASGIYRHVNLV